ncbi:unnamed protein product [Haemonchus placei]|uniref:UBX domain-containing protein n=1 Tax=Haemonchus placei TaxID=6290 RepID=A0A0N4VSL7_HAEPC|nr:unnamed protein product [Haemonchus placei]
MQCIQIRTRHKDQSDTLARPRCSSCRQEKAPVLFAYFASLDEEVLSSLDYSASAAPIVVVRKPNVTLRLCADFSTRFSGLNNALMLSQHPVLTPDDVFTKLNSGTTFAQIDSADAIFKSESMTRRSSQ